MTTFAGRDNILAFANRRYGIVNIEGMGEVRIRSLTEHEYRQVMLQCTDDRSEQFADFAIACMVNAVGEQLFGEMDRDRLLSMDSKVSSRLFAAMMKHLGIGKHETSDDELKKKSLVSSETGCSSQTDGESPTST